MSKAIIMPKFGFTQEEATIVRWIKREGETVEQGEPIAEVTTDKVNMEVEAPSNGVLGGLQFPEGAVVPVTQIIAYLLQPGERAPEAPASPASPTPPPAPVSPQQNVAGATPVAIRTASELGVDINKVTGSGPGGRITREDVIAAAGPIAAIFTPPAIQTVAPAPPAPAPVSSITELPAKPAATPAARRVAGETQVALSSVQGSGPAGRIQAADVEAEAQRRLAEAQQRAAVAPVAPVAPSAPSAPTAPTSSQRSVPFTGMRKTIASRLQRSAQEAPHVTFEVDVDVTAAETLRARANAALKPGQAKVSLTAVIAHACAWALQRHPMMNSRLDAAAGQIWLNDAVNIGIAVALDDGLIVPVVKDAGHKSISVLAGDIADLSTRAKANKLKADEVGVGTFTISNLGMFGVDRFTAIINPPETAILAVGQAVRKFVPDGADQPVVRPILTLRLSADHRVVDGAIAARFISDVRRALEQPDSMLL